MGRGMGWFGSECIIYLEKLLKVHAFLFLDLKQHIIVILLVKKSFGGVRKKKDIEGLF